jgi:hypothetical protein
VTHLNISAPDEKLKALQKFSLAGQYAILFCQCVQRHERDGIIVFPIERVFSTFKARTWCDAWRNSANNKSV